MFDYLQKFNNLPNTLRDKVSSPAAMRAVLALELKYKVDLAALVMKVMTKTLKVKDLPEYFVNEFSLSQNDALALKEEMLKEIFAPVNEYLFLDETKKSPEITEFSSTLIKEAGLSLPSEDLYVRLNNIMLTFLKGVRSKIDVKNSLMKKVEFGGLGLSQEEADKVVKLVEKQEREKNTPIIKEEIKEVESIKDSSLAQTLIDQAVKEEISEEKTLVAPKLEKSSKEKLDQIIMAAETNSSQVYDLKKSVAEKTNKELGLPKEAEQNILPLEEEGAFLPLAKDRLKLEEKIELKPEVNQTPVQEKAPVPSQEEIKAKTQNSSQEITSTPPQTDKIEAEKAIIKEVSPKPDLKKEPEDYVAPQILNLNFKRPAPTSNKPRMEDIKPVAKAMSPIDELAFLDLVNFRRLSDNSDEAVLKIFNKIKLLEKDGYDKMVSGVKAWRQNEVNRLYVKIGQETLLKGLSLKEVIVERQKRNMPFLKVEEINAISKLNGRLSF